MGTILELVLGVTMYLEYFNLKEEPFSITPDPRFLYLSDQYESAIESLLYAIEQRKGFSVLTGEVGTGKTTLCRELLNRLDEKTEVSIVLNPLLSVNGLLKAINADFGNEIVADNADDHLAVLNHYLLSRVEKGINAVVLIDEAQNLSVEALEMTRLLSNLETDRQKLLQIVLVGQPELEDTLKSFRLRQLNQRISIRQRIGAFSLPKLQEYIVHRLSVAGGAGHVDFEPGAIKKIHGHSRGYPRLANILCDRVLLAAFARRTRTIDKKIVKESIADLTGAPLNPWWRFWPCRSY